MSDPRKLNRSDAIKVLWPLSGPYTGDHAVAAADAIVQLSRYLAKAAQPGLLPMSTAPRESVLILGHLRVSADFLGNVYGHIYKQALDLADDPALRHDRNQARAAETATEAAAVLFTAMTLMPSVLLNLTRAAERLGRLSLDGGEEGDQS